MAKGLDVSRPCMIMLQDTMLKQGLVCSVIVIKNIENEMKETLIKMKPLKQVKAWDWNVRIFHWLLLVLVINAWVTAEFGDMEMKWHQINGFAIIFLVSFRIFWGLLGSSTARFTRFIYGPRKMRAYLSATRSGKAQKYLGHNPLGGAMVIALLLMLATQATTGLFSSDGMFANGPLSDRVSESMSEQFSELHEIGFICLLVLVVFHVSAVLFYLFKHKDNLIKPMLNGYKSAAEYEDGKEMQSVSAWRTVLCLVLAALVVYMVNSGFDFSALTGRFK